MELGAAAASAALLGAAMALDLAIGDPQYRWHPIRLMGASVTRLESLLRGARLDGYGGGVVLGLVLAAGWALLAWALAHGAGALHAALGAIAHGLVLYWMLALRNLLDHAWAVEKAARAGDLAAARRATSMFVARDTSAMDLAACRRAAIESLSENLTDGVTSPIFWYAVAGLPGIVAFKVFSTLDSMVGNRSERYVRFGWFSARTDDVLNWIPARLTWALMALLAALLPGFSGAGAWRVGWRQHAVVPGPNSGWSEAAMAGAIRRRLVGPIDLGGRRVTELWIGAAADPPAGEDRNDLPRALWLTLLAGLAAAMLAAWTLAARG